MCPALHDGRVGTKPEGLATLRKHWLPTANPPSLLATRCTRTSQQWAHSRPVAHCATKHSCGRTMTALTQQRRPLAAAPCDELTTNLVNHASDTARRPSHAHLSNEYTQQFGESKKPKSMLRPSPTLLFATAECSSGNCLLPLLLTAPWPIHRKAASGDAVLRLGSVVETPSACRPSPDQAAARATLDQPFIRVTRHGPNGTSWRSDGVDIARLAAFLATSDTLHRAVPLPLPPHHPLHAVDSAAGVLVRPTRCNGIAASRFVNNCKNTCTASLICTCYLPHVLSHKGLTARPSPP
jgi:hypothetical protein